MHMSAITLYLFFLVHLQLLNVLWITHLLFRMLLQLISFTDMVKFSSQLMTQTSNILEKMALTFLGEEAEYFHVRNVKHKKLL